jgi:hypothetical protein
MCVRERDVQVWKNFEVYFKWGWNMSPFNINSVVFHVDDFNYVKTIDPFRLINTLSATVARPLTDCRAKIVRFSLSIIFNK